MNRLTFKFAALGAALVGAPIAMAVFATPKAERQDCFCAADAPELQCLPRGCSET